MLRKSAINNGGQISAEVNMTFESNLCPNGVQLMSDLWDLRTLPGPWLANGFEPPLLATAWVSSKFLSHRIEDMGHLKSPMLILAASRLVPHIGWPRHGDGVNNEPTAVAELSLGTCVDLTCPRSHYLW